MNSRRTIICIIIYRPAGEKIERGMLDLCFARNGDGWGMMYAQDGEVVTHHGMDLAGLHAVYETVPDDVTAAIHFRWRTHGDVGMANNHPYSVLTKEEHGTALWCMHNGVIQMPVADKTASDTRHWIAHKVRPVLEMAPALLGVNEFKDMLEDGISGSRILFVDDADNWTFLNEHNWKKRDGCLYSTHWPVKYQQATIIGVKPPATVPATTALVGAAPVAPARSGHWGGHMTAQDWDEALTKQDKQQREWDDGIRPFVEDATGQRVGQASDDEAGGTDDIYTPDQYHEMYEQYLLDAEITSKLIASLEVDEIEDLMVVRPQEVAEYLNMVSDYIQSTDQVPVLQ